MSAVADVGARASLTVTTVAGDGTLALLAFSGEEAISAPFRYRLSMRVTALGLDPAALLGEPACVTLDEGDRQRHVHGRITRVEVDGPGLQAELVPWLALLAYSSDCRIFQALSIPEIVARVCREAGFADLRDACIRSYAPLDYCVQWNETALAFVERLLEEAGIAYFFEHTAAADTLVLADDPSAHPDSTPAALPFLPPSEAGGWAGAPAVTATRLIYTVTSDAFQSDAYSYLVPATDLGDTAGVGARKVYEYPAKAATKAAVTALVGDRLEALEGERLTLFGTATARGLTAGTVLEVTGHPDAAQGGRWLVTSVRHEATPTSHQALFVARPAAAACRPVRRAVRPRIAGAQTAIVVGPAGSEIWTDVYGRVKVHFYWDQRGLLDDSSSCWVRVAQAWAGKGWGAFSLPRVGQEVVVTFLEGDPDRPLVTGSVYNADMTVPYPLSDNQTRTVLKSSSSPGGSGANELRLEDKAGEEEVFLHAQKDLTIEVENGRLTTVKEADDTLKLLAGNRMIDVAGSEDHKVKGNMALTVSGNLTIKAAGSLTINAGGSLTLSAGASFTMQSGLDINVQAGTGLSLKGGATAELKAPASVTVEASGPATLKGAVVMIN